MSGNETTRGEFDTLHGDHFIFMYHHVGSIEQLRPLSPYVVSRAVFRAQLDSIAARGLRVEPLGDLLMANGVGDRKRPSVVITFDDCAQGLFDFAIPELERRGWKATYFAVAAKVGKYNDWETMPGAPRVPLMRWEDLRQLVTLGHEVGAHGFSHSSLRRCSHSRARAEMCDAKEALEQGTGARIHTFAYPFGEAPDGYPGLCRDADYRGACSIFSMSRRVLGDRFAIRRILASERDVGLRMRAKLSQPYLRSRALLVDRVVLRRSATRPLLHVATGGEPDSEPNARKTNEQ